MAVSTCPSIGNCVSGRGADSWTVEISTVPSGTSAGFTPCSRKSHCKPSKADVRPLRILTYWDGNPNAVPSIGGKSEPKVTVHKYPRNS